MKNKSQFKFLALFFVVIYILNGCIVQSPLNVIDENSKSLTEELKLNFRIQPGGGIAGEVWLQQPVIEIVDSSGTVVTSGPDAFAEIKLTISSGEGALNGVFVTHAILGVAKFNDLSIDLVGSKILKAEKTDSTAFGGTKSIYTESIPVSITSGSANKLLITGSSQKNLGDCLNLNVKLSDTKGNSVNSTELMNLYFAVEGKAKIYSNVECSTEITTATIQSGTSYYSFYVKDITQEIFRILISTTALNISTAFKDIASNKVNISKYFMSANDGHSCILYQNGKVFCEGDNTYGQLGYINSSGAKMVEFNSSINNIVLGRFHSCALLANSSVWCWGRNNYGQLGRGSSDTNINAIPVQVVLPGPASQLISGQLHTCALVNVASVNKIFCWGNNSYRQLGDLSTTQRNSPVEVSLGLSVGVTPVKIKSMDSYYNPLLTYAGYDYNFVILSDGTVKQWGNATNPTLISSLTSVTDISSSYNSYYSSGNVLHFCALLTDKTVKCWGSGLYGQLGSGSFTYRPNPTIIVAGISNVDFIRTSSVGTCVSTADLKTYCWGGNYISDLTDPSWIYYYMSSEHSFSNINLPKIMNFYASNLTSGNGKFCSLENNSDSLFCWAGPILGYMERKTYLTVNNFKQKINLTSSDAFLENDVCYSFDINLLKNNQNYLLPNDILISLNEKSSLVNFYSENSCSNSLTAVTIFGGSSSKKIFFKLNQNLTQNTEIEISANVINSTISSGKITFIKSNPTQFVVKPTGEMYNDSRFGVSYNANFYIATNVCYGIDILFYDSYYNSKTLLANKNVNLTSGNATDVEIYADSGCTERINSGSDVVVQSGTNQKTIYFKGLVDCSGSNITLSNSDFSNFVFGVSTYDACSGD